MVIQSYAITTNTNMSIFSKDNPLKGIKVEKWQKEDEVAEERAWKELLENLKNTEKLTPPLKDLLRTVFGTGFTYGVKHQGIRMLDVLKSLV